jgi:multicomponent Na+:H+ antiporter subunit C
MTSSLVLLAVVGVMLGGGVYLMTDRSLTRILVGVVLASNGVNVMFLLASGRAGEPPFSDRYTAAEISDPLPQAMVLTAIVITLATTAFLLALAYRSFQLEGHDEVPDDVEDQLIVDRAAADQVSSTYDEPDTTQPSEDDTDPAAEDIPDPSQDDAFDDNADERGDSAGDRPWVDAGTTEGSRP